MEKSAPVVLIHYGDSFYLPMVLDCLGRSNPDKMVALLGDETNVKHAVRVGKFLRYADFAVGPRLKEFNEVFQPIQGRQHKFTKEGGIEKWLGFVFQRWFMLFDFARFASIEKFWTFDTDTLIFAPLSPREGRFSAYEATTQCRDCCLNGFIGTRRLLDRYTNFMLGLYKDTDYLAAQRERLEKQAGLAFNEMDAFCEFRRRENVKTFHAARPLGGEFFDDALAYDRNFEASPRRIDHRITVKRLWTDQHGALYARHHESGSFVRMLTCNLSWLPDYVGKKLSRYCLTPEQDAEVTPPHETNLKEIDLSEPFTQKVMIFFGGKTSTIKSASERTRLAIEGQPQSAVAAGITRFEK